MLGGSRGGKEWGGVLPLKGVYLFSKTGILVEVSGEDNNRILSAFPGVF